MALLPDWLTPGVDDRPAPTELDLTEVFELLADDRRRWVIEHVVDADEPKRIGELAELLAYVEADPDPVPYPEDLPSAARKRVYVSLYQTHLPRLADVGAIRYHAEDGVVTPTSTGERLAEIAATVERLNGGGSGG